jgi:hypothetical protein
VELPLSDWELNWRITSAIATALWLYIELSSVAVYVIANLINAEFPYAGTALSVMYNLMLITTKRVLATNILSKVPMAGQVLNQIAAEFLNGNKVTHIVEPFLVVAQVGLMAAAGDTVGKEADRMADFIGRVFAQAILSGLESGLDKAAKRLKSILPEGSAPAVDVLQFVIVTINRHTTENPGSEWFHAFQTSKIKKQADMARLLTLLSKEAESKMSATFVNLAKSETKTREFFDILIDYTGDVMNSAMEKTAVEMDKYIADQIDIVTTQLYPKATGKGAERDKYSIRSGGAKYARDRKLWVNREMKKGKFAKDARCSGAWSVKYIS